MEETRLQKYLASCGIASRRKSEELIAQGRVKVNGNTVVEMGYKVLENDVVEVDGKVIGLEKNKVYIMLNKPTGYVTTVKDQFGRPTVLDLVKDISERIYPVGRLDYDTSGLLILTNDGDFTYKYTHPSHEIKKVYIAKVSGILLKEEIHAFENGLEIDNYVTSPAKLKIIESDGKNSIIQVSIHEGKNRQVRKMCDKIGHTVLSLKRISIGNLSLGDLPEGKWRKLTASELKSFK